MALKKTPHVTFTLRGNTVKKGIRVEGRLIPFNPRWGINRHTSPLLASTKECSLQQHVYVAKTKNGVVLVPCSEEPQRELVLVQEYETGSGAKRWPGFHVEFGEEVRELSHASTCGGSGYETWTLVSAPLGWAENIAGQFQSFRDIESQKISYNPDVVLEKLPKPFEKEGREIAEAITRLVGSADEAYRILEKEYNARYGRASRQSALIAAIPGIEDDLVTIKLAHAATASTLNHLLHQALTHLEKGIESDKSLIEEDDTAVDSSMAAAMRKAGLI